MKMIVGTLFIVCCLIFCTCTPPEGNLSPEEKRVPFDPDLYSWKTASWTPFTVADTVTGFAYGRMPGGKDRFIAVARNGVIAWSDNGDIWHRAVKNPEDEFTDPFAGTLFNAAAYGISPAGSGVFVAVADGEDSPYPKTAASVGRLWAVIKAKDQLVKPSPAIPVSATPASRA
jgi:hypothetical protein